jgi:hypothetical protein
MQADKLSATQRAEPILDTVTSQLQRTTKPGIEYQPSFAARLNNN